jgi:hypothetical protein
VKDYIEAYVLLNWKLENKNHHRIAFLSICYSPAMLHGKNIDEEMWNKPIYEVIKI